MTVEQGGAAPTDARRTRAHGERQSARRRDPAGPCRQDHSPSTLQVGRGKATVLQMTTQADWVDPDLRLLSRSPLVQVVWQVRFTALQDISDGRVALKLQSALGDSTLLTPIPVPQLSFQMFAGGVPQPQPDQQGASPSGQGWRISSEDGFTHVSLLPDSLAVETTQYEGWSNQFYSLIETALNALVDVSKPSVLLRVGMRYINAIFGAALDREPFVEARGLNDVVAPAFLGLLADPTFGASVEAMQSRHMLRVGPIACHIQHLLATADSGELGLLLDLDTFIERTAEFEASTVLALSRDLHLAGLSVFQRSLTPEAWTAMGPTEGRER